MKVGTHTVEISSPDKVLFPESGITKEELIEYYTSISKYMIPHLEYRPISMQRFPNGITKTGFYQKEASDYFPDYVKRIKVKLKNGESKQYVMVNNAATLAYLANHANIPIHTWLSRKGSLSKPDTLIWDLDPSDGDFEKVREAAFIMKDFLNERNIHPFLKTTGSRGVHVVVPIEPKLGFTQVRAAARKLSETLAREYPELMTTEMSKNDRDGRVFVDYLRNGFAQTAIAPYAVRAREDAPVAMPLLWEELKNKKLNSQTYNIKNALKRLKKEGDLWKDLHKNPCSLKDIQL